MGNVLAKRDRLDVGESLQVHNVDGGKSRTVFLGRGNAPDATQVIWVMIVENEVVRSGRDPRSSDNNLPVRWIDDRRAVCPDHIDVRMSQSRFRARDAEGWSDDFAHAGRLPRFHFCCGHIAAPFIEACGGEPSRASRGVVSKLTPVDCVSNPPDAQCDWLVANYRGPTLPTGEERVPSSQRCAR